LLRNERPILKDVDYRAGMASCPSYKSGPLTNEVLEKVIAECTSGMHRFQGAIKPDLCDVIAALVSDSDVLNYSSYEEWAPEVGFDPDSRKGLEVYSECLKTALALRNGIGEEGLAKLKTAFEDY
jgi:hypothetical protein